MSTMELKEMLIDKIGSIDDESVLREISSLIDFELRTNDNYKMCAEEIAAINEGREQIKSGQFLTDEESNRRVDEWVNKHAGL